MAFAKTVLVALCGLMLLAVGGCGGSSSGGTPTATGASSAAPTSGAAAWCAADAKLDAASNRAFAHATTQTFAKVMARFLKEQAATIQQATDAAPASLKGDLRTSIDGLHRIAAGESVSKVSRAPAFKAATAKLDAYYDANCR